MAKKDTQKKLQEIMERRRKADEELKAIKRQLAKEEREERKHCYIEIGKLLESCLDRNFREDDIETFEKFVSENEDLLKEIFAEDVPEDTFDAEEEGSEAETEESAAAEEEDAEQEEAPAPESLPFG